MFKSTGIKSRYYIKHQHEDNEMAVLCATCGYTYGFHSGPYCPTYVPTHDDGVKAKKEFVALKKIKVV